MPVKHKTKDFSKREIFLEFKFCLLTMYLSFDLKIDDIKFPYEAAIWS